MNYHRVVKYAAAGLMLSALGTSALAGSFAIREQSTVGQGASFAGIAAPGNGLSSMFWNPATVTSVNGWNAEYHAAGIMASGSVKLDATTSAALQALGNPGNVGSNALVPSSYSNVQITDRLFLGMASGAPFGLRTKANYPGASQLNSVTFEGKGVALMPTLGYKVTDTFSVGVGIVAHYFKARQTAAVAPTPNSPIASLVGDSINFGFTVGASWQPTESTSIGIGYRSAIFQKLKGTQTLPGAGAFPVTVTLPLPETVTVGVRQKVTNRLTALAGVEWTNWSRMQVLPVNGSPVGSNFVFRYRDGWFFSGGLEYDYNKKLKLRTGLAYEISPIKDSDRTLRLPDNNRIWASIGASYDFTKNLTGDIGYTHIFVKKAPVHASNTVPGLGTFSYSGTHSGSVDIVALSLRYKWGDKPLAGIFADRGNR